MDVQSSVQERYGDGANQCESSLCCAVSYDPQYLKVIPQEVIERDYGCGDPSQYLKEGETVLDLGSGGGKICFIASQIVGETGKVIGVDMTPDMLKLARESAPKVAEEIGYSNVSFLRGHIEDLKTDLDLVDKFLAENPVASVGDYEELTREISRIGKEQPLIEDETIDVIVSNCVLNLVSDVDKKQLFDEMYRVLKVGGRIAVSDIVSDEISPEHLKNDSKLWSGCISGALQEAEFVKMLEDAGFHGIVIDNYESEPWQIVEGIEYRSVTIVAYKGKEGPCIEKNQAVIYKGPWLQVIDDDGHVFCRGERMAVCEKTFNIMNSEPYKDQIIPVEPAIAVETNEDMVCGEGALRHPQETKKGVKPITTDASQGNCC
ncbi:MAG: methyltransferase domain-containing protein [Rhizobiales bacterium]|nr:methyltransferase domain-containing protein [Hyphomicrobiales bacterium]